jgi:hypothetical protein
MAKALEVSLTHSGQVRVKALPRGVEKSRVQSRMFVVVVVFVAAVVADIVTRSHRTMDLHAKPISSGSELSDRNRVETY